jgi:AcrR family transcriptional regulator
VTTPRLSKAEQSAATKRRLLDAAFEEFHRHGFAGARVDRIAERAGVNKRLIYIYFGDKDKLFDVVVARDVETMIDTVLFVADDLPGYAVALFDYLYERPEVIRLFAWRNLERTQTTQAEQASYRGKVAAIVEATEHGRLDAQLPAVDILAFVLGLVASWASSSPALRMLTGADNDDVVRERRRRSIHTAVARLVTPT